MNFFIFLLHRAALIHVPSGTRKKANREKERRKKNFATAPRKRAKKSLREKTVRI